MDFPNISFFSCHTFPCHATCPRTVEVFEVGSGFLQASELGGNSCLALKQ